MDLKEQNPVGCGKHPPKEGKGSPNIKDVGSFEGGLHHVLPIGLG